MLYVFTYTVAALECRREIANISIQGKEIAGVLGTGVKHL
jgi:hypothetical protein